MHVTRTNLSRETAAIRGASDDLIRPSAKNTLFWVGRWVGGIVFAPTNGKRGSTLSCARFANRLTEVATISRLKVHEV